VWGIGHSDEIYKMYEEVAPSTHIRIERLMWAGHVVRMEQHRIPKKVLGSCFGRRRPVRRLRNRWKDEIQRDAANLLRIWNWKLQQEIKRSGGRRFGEAMARKWAEPP
jgi:hypothetical protein